MPVAEREDRSVINRGKVAVREGQLVLESDVFRDDISGSAKAIHCGWRLPVKREHPCAKILARCATVFVLMPSMYAQQEASPRHAGVPQDWSARHVIFSRDSLTLHPDLIYRERRVLHQAMQRWQAPDSNVFHGAASRPGAAYGSGSERDWSVSLGGRLVANMSPAKYSFDPGAPPDCTNDYVVFGLAIPSANGGHPNLVAFNHLYAGAGGLCGSAPKVVFAYNITTAPGGKIVTSPVLSEDGTKIAFVESVGTSAIFHVLTWTAGQGTLQSAAAPSAMASLTYSMSSKDTTSSPWIDYDSDTVYVGADKGLIYKITGVFRGTPTIAGAPWPVTVSTNSRVTSPVFDATLNVLMVGSANGILYKVNTQTGALSKLAVGKSGRTSPGIVAAPVVDVGNGTTFVVSADDGTSGVLVEADTASLTQLAKARLGEAAAGGTPFSLYNPVFSNDYFNDPSTGVARLCGTGATDTTPWQYAFGFTGRILQTTPVFSQQLPTNPSASTAARCTEWTEFFNPNINGGTDFFFFGLTQDCTASGAAGGCVLGLTGDSTFTTATVNGGPSGIVVDNYSTAGQASSIYLTAERQNTAYKFTQNGLR